MLRKGLELWMVEDDAQDQVIYFTTVFFNFFSIILIIQVKFTFVL